jgi:hypothetical protein
MIAALSQRVNLKYGTARQRPVAGDYGEIGQ